MSVSEIRPPKYRYKRIKLPDGSTRDEHRLVMERHLGRYLKPAEVVHHKNEDPADNRLSNLMRFPSNGAHLSHHYQLRLRA